MLVLREMFSRGIVFLKSRAVFSLKAATLIGGGFAVL